MLMYPDDTTLYCNLDQNSTSDSLNNELKFIMNWLDANKLSLHIGKTKHMIYHNINKKVNYPVLTINNVEIEKVTHFLGLVLDSQLNWKKHLDHISLKLSKIIGILHRLKFVYPETVLLMLYNTLIVPHLTYCILSWGSLLSDNHRIHVLQKKGLRIVAGGGYLSHTEPICKQMQLLKVADMFRVALRNFYFKLMNNLLSSYFDIFKPTLGVVCSFYDIRKPLFSLPKPNIELQKSSLKYVLSKLLNEENGCISITSKVHTHSFQGYKRYVKNVILNNYCDICLIRNCYVCKISK